MKVTFLGTGTSMGVPVAGGFGQEKLGGDPRNVRSRCSVWVQTGRLSILVDAGPEFRIQSIRSGIQRIDLILITHEHMDHIAGIDDIRAYNYAQKDTIPLYSTENGIQAIRSRFDYLFGKNKYPGSAAIDLNIIEKQIIIGDVTITPLPVSHGSIKVNGYRINDFSYITDVKKIPEDTKKLISGSKTLVLSGLRWSPPHPTHLTIPEAVDVADELKIPQTFLVHMNSYVNHKKTNEKLPSHVRLAYDMLEIKI
ncbi:MAG: MBL fold metallo-hydrolase [Balneolaceae bacterium]